MTSVAAENTSRVVDIHNVLQDMTGKQIDAVFEEIEKDCLNFLLIDRKDFAMVSVVKDD